MDFYFDAGAFNYKAEIYRALPLSLLLLSSRLNSRNSDLLRVVQHTYILEVSTFSYNKFKCFQFAGF